MIWRLIDAFRGGTGVDIALVLTQLAATAIVLIFCLPVHELAHAWAAKKLGDDTAAMHGRLTLNPARHLDIFGTLMILTVGFGYAKPVPVNPRNFKNRRKGMALTAAAGPLSNLIMAVAFCLLYFILLYVVAFAAAARGESSIDFNSPGGLVLAFVYVLFLRNVGLMVFNLIPFPPLDGSRIMDLLLPAKWSYSYAKYEPLLRWGVFALLLFSGPLSWLIEKTADGIYFVVGLPFRLI